MLLTLTTTHQPATDLGYLLHKHPDKHQVFSLPFGTATRLHRVQPLHHASLLRKRRQRHQHVAKPSD